MELIRYRPIAKRGRETNMQPLPRAWWQDRCCRGSPLLSGPVTLCSRATSWNTHWAQGRSPTVLPLHTTASLWQDYAGMCMCIQINPWILKDAWCFSFSVSPPSRPPSLLSAVSVWISGLPVFSTAGEERSDAQTMSRQACHQTSAPVLHLTQTANRTETSR